MRKETIWQRNMSALEVREDLLEAKGAELRARSLRTARNVTALASGVVEARPGTVMVRAISFPRQIVEISPADGLTYAVVLHDDLLEVIDQNDVVVFEDNSVPWNIGTRPWILPIREETIIGDPDTGLYVLRYDGANFSLGDFVFTEGAGGERLQPYWAFHNGITLTPSAVTGSITLTASAAAFTSSQVGTRIRWHDREIQITGFTNSTTVTGTVISRLPPSFELTVGSTENMRVYDTLEQADTKFTSVVSQVVSSTLVRVVAFDNFEGPDVTAGAKVSVPSGSTTITAKSVISPQPSRIWTEQLMSARRKWPRSGAIVAGRLVLTDFPGVPNAVALSAAGRFNDFKVGTEDDAGILRTVGRGARIRHAVNAGDLLLFTERECLVTNIRAGGLVTPSNFAALAFDGKGAGAAKPVVVDDSVLFVDAGGKSVSLAVLDGSSELRWKVRNLTAFHSHLIQDPVALCGPATGTAEALGRAFVINLLGDVVAISWTDALGAESMGFAPWDTRGQIRHIAPAFGKHWVLVDRSIQGENRRFVERFEEGVYLDCAVVRNPNATAIEPHLEGETTWVVWRSFGVGTGTMQADGTVDGMEFVTSAAQIGLNFNCEAGFWPVDAINSPRLGTMTPRVVRFIVSVQGTALFDVRCNANTRTLGDYRFGSSLEAAPSLNTDVYRIPVMGRRTHPDLAVRRTVPGPFRILATAQEVQV